MHNQKNTQTDMWVVIPILINLCECAWIVIVS